MALFKKDTIALLSNNHDIDMAKASLNMDLSAVDFDEDNKYFYVTVDKLLFENPVDTIKKILDAHGYVANLENILSCLDSCTLAVHAKLGAKPKNSDAGRPVKDYLPCMQFKLPEQNTSVGDILQSFYDELANYDAKNPKKPKLHQTIHGGRGDQKDNSKEVAKLKAEISALKQQVNGLHAELKNQKNAHSSQSNKGISNDDLPGNTKICRVDHIDLKRRIMKVKAVRKSIDIPTHMLDRVPEFKARCLVTLDDDGQSPIGILFFDPEERGGIDKRVADLLYVEGDTFKARDSLRNEFQVQALNPMESQTINGLRRGMKVLISIADGYVVRFSVIKADDNQHFLSTIREQFAVHDIGRNQLESANKDNPHEQQ